MSAPNPNVQRVPKMLMAVNDWIASGKVNKEQGQQLSTLTLQKNEQIMLLADEIGTTPDSDLLAKALAVSSSSASSSSSSTVAASGSASSSSSSSAAPVARGPAARKGRPALNIGAVKDANATAEAARADEVESQADALLRAKRMRNLKRQSMPEKGLPDSVSSQVQQ